jgi:iron complex transport system substrate-binding protein
MLKTFCGMTGRDDLYQQNGEAVKAQIDAVVKTVSDAEGDAAQGAAAAGLLLRLQGQGLRQRGRRHPQGSGGGESGRQRKEPSGGRESGGYHRRRPRLHLSWCPWAARSSAETWLAENFQSNPAWAELSAVKSGSYAMLPKELFHYKPNAKWGESYEYLAKLLYPALADKLA